MSAYLALTPAERIAYIARISKGDVALIQTAIDDIDPTICAHALLMMLRRGWKGAAIRKYLPSLLDRALQDHTCWYLQSTLADILTEHEDLSALYRTENWNVYLALANNPHCPVFILEKLSSLKPQPSEKIADRYDVIRDIAQKRLGLEAKAPEEMKT